MRETASYLVGGARLLLYRSYKMAAKNRVLFSQFSENYTQMLAVLK
jgi:hypothetical protein